jgi:hypothetical protein
LKEKRHGSPWRFRFHEGKFFMMCETRLHHQHVRWLDEVTPEARRGAVLLFPVTGSLNPVQLSGWRSIGG